MAKPEKEKINIARVFINRDVCRGTGCCVALSKDFFMLDEENKAYVVKSGDFDSEAVLLAARACPTKAISVFDEAGNQVYPMT